MRAHIFFFILAIFVIILTSCFTVKNSATQLKIEDFEGVYTEKVTHYPMYTLADYFFIDFDWGATGFPKKGDSITCVIRAIPQDKIAIETIKNNKSVRIDSMEVSLVNSKLILKAQKKHDFSQGYVLSYSEHSKTRLQLTSAKNLSLSNINKFYVRALLIPINEDYREINNIVYLRKHNQL